MKKYIGCLLACGMIAAVPDVTAIHAEDETGETEKNETVYIITDGSGKPDDVVVSEWLKNVKKADVLKDVFYIVFLDKNHEFAPSRKL